MTQPAPPAATPEPARPAATPAKIRRRRWPRITGAVVGATLILLLGGITATALLFDPNSLKPRLVAAVREATGRELALNGAIGLKLSLIPTIAVHDVALSNPAGFSRPHMATLESLELRLGLLPLLSGRIEVVRLLLVRPDILLETNAKGEVNWRFEPAAKPPSPARAGTPATAGGDALPHVAEARISDGRLTWRDAGQPHPQVLGISSLGLTAAAADAPLRLDADLRVNDAPLTVQAETGPLPRLLRPAGAAPLPLTLHLASGGARISLEGSIAEPDRGKGYALTLHAAVPDLAALGGFLPGISLPAGRDIAISARLQDAGNPLPDVTGITLRTGALDLPAEAGGARIERLEIAAPGPGQPIRLAVNGRLQGIAAALSGTLSHPGFTAPASTPIAVDLLAEAAGATVTVKGDIAHPADLSGVALALTARIADLAELAPLAGQKLPSVKAIAFKGRLEDMAGGLEAGAALKDFALSLPQGDLGGDATVGLRGKRAIHATLRADRLDLDGMLAALSRDPPQAGAPATTEPRPPEPRTTEPRPTAGTPNDGRLFPDTELPFDTLRDLTADLRLRVGTLRLKNEDYRTIEARLVIDDGRLRLDPFVAQAPQGRVSATLTADTSQAAPKLHLTARAPGLSAAALLAGTSLRKMIDGNVELHADLTGAGHSPRAIAASLSGTVGVAMAGGTIDTRILGNSVGKAAKDLPLLDPLGRGGGVADIRCVGIRFDARDGLAQARTLVLSSSLLTTDGGGSVNLRDETLNLLLRPQGRVGGTGFRVPVRVAGPLRAPRVDVDATGSAEANAGALAGIIIGTATPLGAVGGLLGADRVLEGNPCPTALALARGGATPVEAAQGPVSGPVSAPVPAPATAPATAPAARPAQQPAARLPDAGRLLRQLFR
jgi:AsmA protein